MTRFVTIAVISVLVCVLVSLGFWQLQRADQKQLLLDQQATQLVRPVVRLYPERDTLEKVRFLPVFLDGQFDCDHQILLDNKMSNRQPGFHVITAFRPSLGGKSILVNRGWIPMHANRSPDQQYQFCQSQMLRLQGIVNHFPRLGYHFSGSTDSTTDEWPLMMLELDEKKLSSVLNDAVVGYLLLMDPSIKGGFVRDWHFAPNILPEKHIAYAVQWFGLAITLIILSLWRLWRNKHDKQ